MIKKVKKLWEISIIKTVRFNIHYFGIKGLKLPVIVNKNFILSNLEGEVFINDSVSTGDIRLGTNGVGIFNRKIDRGIWANSGKITFQGKCYIGLGTKISNNLNGQIIFGNNFSISAKTEIICFESIKFGEDVMISWDCLLFDSDMHQILNDRNEQINQNKAINIGNHVWIGCRSVILKGSSIKDNSVIASNSTITNSFEQEHIVIGGVNKILKEDINWMR